MNSGKKRIALIGSEGMLAHMVRRECPEIYELSLFDLPYFDITNREQVRQALHDIKPDVIVNCAAYTNVDGSETDEETANRVNGLGPGYLAEAAGESGAVLVHISTDYVFAGDKETPYTEDDATNPMSAYGRSKLRGELAIAGSGTGKYFIIRTSWLYGPHGKNFVETIARLASEREELRIVNDQIGCPTYTEDLARAIFSLLETDAYGIYHFSNEGMCSWYEFAREIVIQLHNASTPVKVKKVLPIRTDEYPLPAPRPPYSVFSKDKFKRATGTDVPYWRDSLVRYFAQRTL